MTIRRAVLLIGSAKAPGTSTSESLGQYLCERLAERGVGTTVLAVNRSALHREDARLAAAVAEADLFVVATPLYVDSLPYLVTRALESLAAERRRAAATHCCAFVGIVNCGFPESHQCRTALEILRLFARAAGFRWAGGLAVGEGGAIDGRPLEALGTLTKRVRAALDRAAATLVDGADVPGEAVALCAKPMLPYVVYTMMANASWRRTARRNGVRRQLRSRPFD